MTDWGNTLVFADDGSPSADIAWLWAISHAWDGWVADIVTATAPTFPPTADRPADEPQPWTSPYARVVPPAAGFAEVRELAAPGDPRAVLCHQTHASLLVLGTRGLSRVRGVLLGSTTHWLLHHPPSPMAVIRSARPTRHALVCVDGSRHARRAVEVLAGVPWAPDVEVTALGVEDGRTNVTSALDDALAVLEGAGVPTKARRAQGAPAEKILQVTDELVPDLVVMGTRGLTGWERLRLGSTAFAVVQAAPCSALVACAD